ncbi:hypothetical protein MMC08_007285, partial [Hypocenomyce scalaris]|nr:hypothetical protein [Hypocenomyce scalaris]
MKAEVPTQVINNPERYPSLWFKGVATTEIRREIFKEWLCFAFLNKGTWGPDDD